MMVKNLINMRWIKEDKNIKQLSFYLLLLLFLSFLSFFQTNEAYALDPYYYVAVGDSITRGSQDDIGSDGIGYEPVLKNLLDSETGYSHTVINEGISGDDSSDGLDFLPAILNAHPEATYFLVQFGTNDAWTPRPSGLDLQPGDDGYAGSFKDNIQQIITAIKNAGKIPYLAEVPIAFDPYTALNPYLQLYNLVIHQLRTENSISVVPPPFYCFFESNPDQIADGLHPNGVGYQSMAILWRDSLMNLPPSLTDCNDECNNLIDSDGDGTGDCDDLCPNDPNKTEPGICGCGIADTDSDGDGTVDCNDGCPNDPGKTESGICGCGVPDVDTDSDNTLDCNDNCPNDPNKTQIGICGCGVTDTDSDSDGIPDCNDNCDNLIDSDGDGTNDCDDLCPDDPQKIGPGICGCGLSDTDSDNDGTLDCIDTNDDNDGLPDVEEQGPDGNDPNYDGNGDGTADRLQDNVASLHTYDNQYYITIESSAGTSISNCKAADNPSPTNAPSDVEFFYGFFEFRIDGVGNGDTTTVTFYFPVGETIDTYYKYGPTPNNINNHWYEFLYDGQTGAEISGNVITLYFVDGMRGDDDLTANGIVVDVGTPAVTSAPGGGGGITTLASGGVGGGGCFIATAAYGSLMEPHVKILRDFRDRFLLGSSVGDSFVRHYYTYSPPIADFIARHDSLRAMVRISLLPVVGMSWITLKIGPPSTLALLVLFISCLFGFVWLGRRYKE